MNKIKTRLKQYFLQSFRKRTKDDYKNIFTRGLDGGNTAYRVYPWFYLRVLAVFFVVFTVYAVTVSVLHGSAMDRLSFYIIGGSFLDIAMLVLLYELYPHNDFSLLKIACVTFVAGSAAALLSALIYNIKFFGIEMEGWYLAVTAGVGEEIAKAVPAVICISIFKKKDSPLSGFLIGAAVGTWFSLTENAGYIWGYSQMYAKILTAVVRALGCVFSHAMWTALISWAYCKFKKPFLNFRFYGVVLFCMAMHFCIDMPLADYVIILCAEAAVCGLATLIFGSVVFYKERKSVLEKLPVEQAEELPPFPPLHRANLTATGFGAVLCVMLLILSAVFSPIVYKKTAFTKDEFILYAQNGYAFSPEPEREYDENYENYSEYYELEEGTNEKLLKHCEQRVRAGEVTYAYYYVLYPVPVKDEDTGEERVEQILKLWRTDVIVTVDGEEKRYDSYAFITGSTDEALSVISVYPLNPDVYMNRWEVKNDKIVLYKAVNGLDWQTITMLCVCAAVAIFGITTYAVMRKKIKE